MDVTEYCSELYEETEKNTDLTMENERNAPPPNEDEEQRKRSYMKMWKLQ